MEKSPEVFDSNWFSAIAKFHSINRQLSIPALWQEVISGIVLIAALMKVKVISMTEFAKVEKGKRHLQMWWFLWPSTTARILSRGSINSV